MKKLFSAFTFAFMVLSMVSCTGETVDYSEPPLAEPTEPTEPTKPTEPSVPTVDLSGELPDVISPSEASAPLSSISSDAIEGFNDFSLKFYLANSAQGHDNVCVSPFSVGAVLGMIANGDDGAARNEILKMLGFEESEAGLNALNAYYQALLSNLPNLEEGISCDVTNTMWCDPFAYRIRKSFMQSIMDHYYAYGIGISPGGSNGQMAINDFVEKNTNGLIKNFLQSPLDISIAFLNTLYFKAGWTEGFAEYMTSKDIFLDITGKEQEVDFMNSCDWREYAMTEDGTEAVRLYYGEQRQFSMTCVLPSSKINHIPLDEALADDNIKKINSLLKKEYTMLRLPKFEVESNNPSTLDILKQLGLEKVCSGQPFRSIAVSDELYMTCFIHATKLKVDENGTEGAAVSLGGMDNSVGDGSSIREIVFDRPFIFYIQENTTGTILFIGSVKTFS